MKYGCVIFEGQILQVIEGSYGQVQLFDGCLVVEIVVQWLLLLQFGIVFVLGLNYVDYVKEIVFNKVFEELLVFFKGLNMLNGYYGCMYWFVDVVYMYFECELGVVIGKICCNVCCEDVYGVVVGYCLDW